MAQAPTGIEVRAKVFPLAFLVYLFKPTVEIDGQPIPAKWGTQFIPVQPGTHSVSLYYRYLFFKRANAATTQATLSEGQVLQITYKTRWLVFLPGKIDVQPWAPAVGA
jgi:hypothetical protein